MPPACAGSAPGWEGGLCAGKSRGYLPFTPYLEGLLARSGYEPKTVISVDIAARSLFPDNAVKYVDRVDLAIDHHPSQEFFAHDTCLDEKKSGLRRVDV